MTIKTLYKITLCSDMKNKENLIKDLQNLGCVHINSLKHKSLIPEIVTPYLIDNIQKSLSYLRESTNKRKIVMLQPDFDVKETVNRILKNRKDFSKALDKLEIVKTYINKLSAWGNFKFPQEKDLDGYKLWFYIIDSKKLSSIPTKYVFQEVIKKDNRSHILVISKEEPDQNDFSKERVHTGATSLEDLYKELEDTNILLQDLKDELSMLSQYRYLLSKQVAYYTDEASCKKTSLKTLDEENFFLLQGWIPVTLKTKLSKFAEQNDIGIIFEEATKDDNPPTLFENKESLTAGEELVNFYQTPGYRTIDPSIVVFFSFSLFFAMILSDAGYALILSIFTAFSWKKIGSSKIGFKIRNLIATICGSSLVYGIIIGSYFGISPPKDSFLYLLRILDINNFDNMIKLSIFIGCLHIFLANFIIALKTISKSTRYKSIGFSVILSGGFSMLIIPQKYYFIAYLILALGSIIIFFGGSDESLKDSKNIIQFLIKRSLDGFISLTSLSKLFGDIMSYMRLFALGLAGASLSITFNNLASQIYESSPSAGILFASLILILGHSLNLLLAIMSGVVHGLRLNFIEFFNWSIPEEGFKYKAFKHMEINHE